MLAETVPCVDLIDENILPIADVCLLVRDADIVHGGVVSCKQYRVITTVITLNNTHTKSVNCAVISMLLH